MNERAEMTLLCYTLSSSGGVDIVSALLHTDDLIAQGIDVPDATASFAHDNAGDGR